MRKDAGKQGREVGRLEEFAPFDTPW